MPLKKKNTHNQRKTNKSPQPSHQTKSTHQREGKSIFLKKAVCSDLCKCEVLLPIFNQFVHPIKIIWNTIKCRPENLFNIDHLWKVSQNRGYYTFLAASQQQTTI